MDYRQIKSLVRLYANADQRLGNEGLVWGENKRLQDERETWTLFPYFWVMDATWVLQEVEDGALIEGWKLEIEVAGDAMRGLIQDEESALEESHKIVSDFSKWLKQKAQAGALYFDIKNNQAQIVDADGKSNAWGWHFFVIIGSWVSNVCPQGELMPVWVLEPQAQEGATETKLQIDGELLTISWDGTAAERLRMLSDMALAITTNGTIQATATLDENHIYITGYEATTELALELELESAHSWSEILTEF